jgi:asparagine N-glycosylation enzyme membrane subunit Stt3
LHPYRETDVDGGQWVPIVLQRYFPGSYPRFLASRQSTGGIALRWIRPLHAVVAALSAVVLLLLARRFKKGDDRLGFALAVVLLAGIVINGVASGSFSVPHDRYQSRVIWLAVFGALVGTARTLAERSDQT